MPLLLLLLVKFQTYSNFKVPNYLIRTQRSDRQRPNEQVLMRALCDFNIPKIASNIPVFMCIIGDLFLSIDIPRKHSSDFVKLSHQSALVPCLEAKNGSALKVTKVEI